MIKLVPNKYKGLGLNVWCKKCKAQKTVKNPCSHKSEWKYKMIIQRNNKKHYRMCESTELQNAIHELYDFRKEIESRTRIVATNVGSVSLQEGIARYLDSVFKRGEFNVEDSNTDEHEKECLRVIKRFKESLEYAGFNPDKLKLSEINEKMLSPFYEHIKKCGVKANATRDRHTRIMRAFLTFLQNRGMYMGPNLFKSVKTSAITSNPVSITDEEYIKVIDAISEKNGWGIKGSNRRKFYYREWLPNLFRLARYTGLRREELYELRWSSLVTLESGKQYFLVKDFKKSRHMKKDYFKPVPITKKVKEILDSISVRKGDKVIMAYEFKSVDAFNDFISRAFSHFFGVGVSRQYKKTFKQLRKSQMTDISAILGDKAYLASGHSGNAILDGHYVDRVEMAIRMLELEE